MEYKSSSLFCSCRLYLMPWIGGKRQLRKTIAEFIPHDIKSFFEPFGGAGWIFFFKERWAECEVYNDIDSRLVNLFRIMKFHPRALIEELNLMLHSRETFEEEKLRNPITDIQKAASFFFLVNHSFGGKAEGSLAFQGHPEHTSASFSGMFDRIQKIHSRLDKVLIENLDFEKFIEKFDRDASFFYCDPPYVQGEKYYETTAGGFDHSRLASLLSKIKGRFLLSYDDCSEVRELYKDFEMVEITRNKGINLLAKDRAFRELLIANYPIKHLGFCQTKLL